MNLYLILPILVPFFTGLAALFTWKHSNIQRIVHCTGAGGLLISAVWLFVSVWPDRIVSVQIGNWPAPFGITLIADLLSAALVLISAIIAIAVGVYATVDMDERRVAFGFFPLFQIMMMGVCGAFLAGDIFNLYVWFEVMLIASFVQLELGGELPQLEGTIKYVAMNLTSSAIFLSAVGLTYSTVGTLNIADMADRISTVNAEGLTGAIAVLFLVAFGIKAAVFPLYFWLPASYHTPPASVSAIFAGLLTKVGVYALFRMFTIVFVRDPHIHTLLMTIAGSTLLFGILGALIQNNLRRLLSFTLFSHIGYMIMGLGILTPLALSGAVFYLISDIVDITALFLVSGLILRMSGVYRLQPGGGLYRRFPLISLLFLIPAFSMAGIPPLAGFWGKLILIKAGLAAHRYVLVTAALATAFFTLWTMGKVWLDVFWKPASNQIENTERPSLWLIAPIVFLVGIGLLIGFFPEPLYRLSANAAEQMMRPESYIRVVLGETK